MLPKFSTRKLIQISEESSPPAHAPVLIDNEYYILSQQDVRKSEECRLFALHKLMPNGELKPLNSINFEGLLQYLEQQNLACQQNLLNLYKTINNPTNYQQTDPQEMDISPKPSVNHTQASINQQVQWDKCISTSSPFPMTYSCATSTTELDNKELNLGQQLNNLKKASKCCCKLIRMCNKSTCMQDEPLGAREQLKQKKLNNSLEYIT
ncbi:hypothetical protein DOY81_002843 [Sarcophaga bullata]|nr:hypothetical protein DOY81_002843 [Sarcophaga bullata]